MWLGLYVLKRYCQGEGSAKVEAGREFEPKEQESDVVSNPLTRNHYKRGGSSYKIDTEPTSILVNDM